MCVSDLFLRELITGSENLCRRIEIYLQFFEEEFFAFFYQEFYSEFRYPMFGILLFTAVKILFLQRNNCKNKMKGI